MPIRFRCVYCDQLLGIARRKAGTVVKCPNCAGQLIVPAPERKEPALAGKSNRGSRKNSASAPAPAPAPLDSFDFSAPAVHPAPMSAVAAAPPRPPAAVAASKPRPGILLTPIKLVL